MDYVELPDKKEDEMVLKFGLRHYSFIHKKVQDDDETKDFDDTESLTDEQLQQKITTIVLGGEITKSD